MIYRTYENVSLYRIAQFLNLNNVAIGDIVSSPSVKADGSGYFVVIQVAAGAPNFPEDDGSKYKDNRQEYIP